MSLPVSRRIFSCFRTCRSLQLVVRTVANGATSTTRVTDTTRATDTGENTPSVKDRSERATSTPASDTMSAAVLKQFGSALTVETIQQPKILKSNEVLVDVHYCALNGIDVLISKNLHKCTQNPPFVLGFEVVGEIVELGDDASKNSYKVGDKVAVLNKERFGGLADRCIAEIGDVWKIPSNVKMLDAVCSLENYITSLIGLEKHADLEEEDMILINVGVGSIGLAAADLAANVFRAKVIGVCATEDLATLVRERGAHAALKYNDKKLMKHISVVAAERNIKSIFADAEGAQFKKVLDRFTDIYKSKSLLTDMLRNDNFAVVVQHLSREGRVIVAGVAVTEVDPQLEPEKESFSLSGISLQKYRQKDHMLYRQYGEDVLQFLEEGLISPERSLIIGLSSINDALETVAELKTPGKIVIDIKNKETKKDLKQ
ncbi:quinone oxidoreductase-like protein 2 isoform X1 [Orussus abietinus]|uniref:quinone oxidoreductase-like protein 2 isoform X1 n=1 Tax=Orussus abietinus TaxID=222816 RepID=UPI000626408B|nr:quinone oxidoreductase-like protein 2 isoform X1 [Orussus abietinus]